MKLKDKVRILTAGDRFVDVIDTYNPPQGTPAGFRIAYTLREGGVLTADLIRDINCGENGKPRPTNVLFSADVANPYEIETILPLIANVTTNPVIIYDRFLTDPKANADGKFKTREEVIREIARVVGSRADISVELNNPFASDLEILEEVHFFEELIPKYNLVIKVPHVGPLTGNNVRSFAAGSFEKGYDEPTVESAFRPHHIAAMLYDHGYRVNFTLMFESHQIALALQAKPAFINCFVRNRYFVNALLDKKLKCFEVTGDEIYLEELREYMKSQYYLSPRESEISLFEVKRRAQWILHNREWVSDGYNDALDEARAALRQLRAANLPDTRLIICSLAGEQMYALTDKFVVNEAYGDMAGRIVVSVAPDYLAQFTASPEVLAYNKKFFLAAEKEPDERKGNGHAYESDRG
ncbi:MAG: transaldolase [Clostridiales Family XIII bacterium]|nr:transaldolase [Clostridiales Family XIII bacterium]